MIEQLDTLPSPKELFEAIPANDTIKSFVADTRIQISKILDGADRRLLMIVGPCSIHDITAAKEYASKLKQLAAELDEQYLLVMRVYFEKPRTSKGWKGFLYDPHLDGSHNIAEGLYQGRKLLADLAEMGVATASEFLDPLSFYYFGDLVSWGCIGARTTASQTHRQLASGLAMPVAFKNSTDGNINVAINGIVSASHGHTFLGINENGHVTRVRTQGNSQGHLVLRGSEHGPNYSPANIEKAVQLLNQAKIPPRLLVDCSHDNSYRKYKQQEEVFTSVIQQVVNGNSFIRGLLLESHLNSGNQPFTNNPTQLKYAVSLTDACLEWDATAELLLWGHQQLKNRSCNVENLECLGSFFNSSSCC